MERLTERRESPALRPGLFFARWAAVQWGIRCVAAAALVACAGGPGPQGGGAATTELGVTPREAAEELRAAEELLEAGHAAEAAARADSLFAAWQNIASLTSLAERALWLKGRALEATGELDAAIGALRTLLGRAEPGERRWEGTARLAALLHLTARDAETVRLLLEEPEAAGEEELVLMRQAALRLSLDELKTLAVRYPLTPGPSVVLHGELARALALADRLDSARRVARGVANAAEAQGEEARLAEALMALESGAARRVRIGAILPLTGRFQAVGELLREGMSLALAEYRASEPEGLEVELVVEDDGSSPEQAVELASKVEREGVVAVLGPVRSEPFSAAARARTNPRLLFLSPTATQPSGERSAYTLWASERREREIAREVGGWIVGVLGLRRTAVFYPRTASGRAALEGFEQGVQGGDGELLGSRAYEPGETMFADPISELAVLEPDAVFVAAGSAPEVLQIAPQLAYFGLDHSVIAGGSTWSEPTVVRRLDPFAADYRIIGTQLDRTTDTSGWARFRSSYERKYRKSLRENILPALGYDAFKLALAAIEAARLPLPGSVSRAATSLGPIEGATGTLRFVPQSSTVERRTLIRMLVDGGLVPAERGAMLAWLERARFRADSVAQARADSVARARADSVARARRSEEPPS